MYTKAEFPLSQEQFREFLKSTPGPFTPSHSHTCPLAAALRAAGLQHVTIGTETAYWQRPDDPAFYCTALPAWAEQFRHTYDRRGQYGGSGPVEGVPALQLLDELFPPPPVAEQPA